MRGRAFLIGVLLCLFISAAEPYATLVLKAPSMAFDMSAPWAVLLLLLLVSLNGLATGLKREAILSRTELLTVYVMMLMACAVPTRGVMQLLPVMTSPYYYASPENRWEELIHPHLKNWMVVSEREAVRDFYGGLRGEEGVPWRLWLAPLTAWFSLFMGVYLAMILTMVLLRKQWMENERLTYPLAQLPLEMVDRGRFFFRSHALWLGVLSAFAVLSLNRLRNHLPFVPQIKLQHEVLFFMGGMQFLRFYVLFALIGFTYFISTEVAFSLWFFSLLFKLLQVGMDTFGLSMVEFLGPYTPGRARTFIHQDMGAMIAMVLMGLWASRGSLRAVLMRALSGADQGSHADGVVSDRGALLGLVAVLGFIGVWLWGSGVVGWVVPPFLLGAFVLFWALTRIVCEAGLPQVGAPMTAAAFVTSGMGSVNLPPQTLAALGFTFPWSGEVTTSAMAFCAYGLKLFEDVKGGKGFLLWSMITGLAVCFIGTAATMLWIGYKFGGANLGGFPFITGARAPFHEFAVPFMMQPTQPRIDGWIWTAVGALGMWLLTAARHRFTWFPLHPIGFALSSVWAMQTGWFSIFIAWLLKSAIMRYGGLKPYRLVRPFFLGLILGEFAANGVWLIVDAIFH